MSPDSAYFFWASPIQDKPLFALYDAFDNHLMMLSYSHDLLFSTRKIIRSKTMLDIVELTDIPNLVEHNIIDNSVVENWGLESTHSDLFRDATPKWRNQNNSEIFYKTATIKDPVLTAVDSKFDNFKRDLQHQLFFIHYCLEHSSSDQILAHLQASVELGIDFSNTVDRFLDLTTISNKVAMQDMLSFLRSTGLFYE